MADTKISALAAASAAAAANEFAINEAGTSKKLTMDLIREFIIKRTAAATTAAGEFMTWLVLAANSLPITGVTPVTVMTITGVGVGRYYFKCQLIWQAAVSTTGMGVHVNHTGTTTQFIAEVRHSDTTNTATTHGNTMAGNNAAGNAYCSQASRTKNALIGSVSISVDTANSDMLTMIEGFFVVSVTGSLEIKMQAELAALVITAMQGSFLELTKLS